MVFGRREQVDLVKLGDLADAGKLIVRVGRRFPLDQAADAQRTLREGNANGKVVLEIASVTEYDSKSQPLGREPCRSR